jgi:hypothetical protein
MDDWLNHNPDDKRTKVIAETITNALHPKELSIRARRFFSSLSKIGLLKKR